MSRSTPEALVAAFLDSAEARCLPLASVAERRRAALLIVRSALADVGARIHLLDGAQVRELLLRGVARRLGSNDPLTTAIPTVARALFAYLGGAEMVPHAFEIDMSLTAIDEEFVAAARAVTPELRILGPTETLRNRAAQVGRNDPCPCGSGRKFKQCCLKLGR